MELYLCSFVARVLLCRPCAGVCCVVYRYYVHCAVTYFLALIKNKKKKTNKRIGIKIDVPVTISISMMYMYVYLPTK